MMAREVQEPDQAAVGESALESDLRNLLDHIAVELAEEYIRLMEAAADSEAKGQQPVETQ